MKNYVDKDKLQEFATKLHAKQKTIFATKAEVGSPLVASTVAGMTDTNRIYVYIGSESGYTSGNWYYYDGSAWVSGGVYNAVAFETDDTLSISGAAADAAATGAVKQLAETNQSNIDFISQDIPTKYKTNVEAAFNVMYNGTNAVDYTAITQGKYANVNTGNFVDASGFAITDFIPVRHGMIMTANKHASSNNAGTCFYDINKQFIIGYRGVAGNLTLIVPEGAAFVVVATRTADISSLTVYLKMDVIDKTVKVSTDNIDTAESSLMNGNNVINQTLISAATRINATNGHTSSNQYTFATHYIPIREGMRLTMNKTIDSSYGTAFYDINKNFIEGYPSTSGNKVLTAPTGAAFVRMTFLNSDLETATAIISAKAIDEAKAFTVINQKTKWLAMGDSITFGVFSKFTESGTTTGEFDGWVRFLASALNFDITVMASKGMGYTASVTGQDPEGGDTRISISTLLDRAVALAGDFNLITIAYGINDYNNPSQSTLQTILAGLDEAIQKLGAAYKFARIVVITPFNSSRYGDQTTNYAYKYKRTNNLSVEDIAIAIKERCAYYGVECIDASNGFLLNNYNITELLPDGVHPAEETHALIAKTMAHKLVY